MLIETDLPEPVVPATRRCGILARSAMTGSPLMVLPSDSASFALELSKSVEARSSRRKTVSRLRVRQLDADGVLARDDRDTRRDGAHRAGDVVGKADDARRLDARRRLKLVERDDRAGAHVDDLAAYAEILEHAFQQPRVLLERALIDRASSLRRCFGGSDRRCSGGSSNSAEGSKRRLRLLLDAGALLRARRRRL